MAHKLFLFNLFILPFFLGTCNSLEPPPPDEKPTLSLELEDVSCIEAWMKLTTTNLQLPITITLKQSSAGGDQTVKTINLNRADTLLYIDSLLPNISYQYQASSIQHQVTSNVLSVTTMDTTSHNFTFETFTFGTIGSSVLRDVAIIDENNIWAVGLIFMPDSTGNDYISYNAVHWDGNEWELKRIPFLYQGDSLYGPIYSVFAFNPDDIWFGIGSMIHWDGEKYWSIGTSSVFPSLVNKIWGSSSNDLYIVGNNGNIAWYNGTSWRRIESGTELNIHDIWGVADGNGKYNKYLAADNVMLKIDAGNHLSRINANPNMIIISVWGISDRLIYTAGGGVVLYKNFQWEKIDKPEVNSINRIRGQHYNDVFGIGSLGSIVHYNGYSWHSINTNQSNRFWRIDVKGNLITASGYQGELAQITIIRRIN